MTKRDDTIPCWVCGHNTQPGSGHLEMLKRMRIRVSEAVFSDETAPRDLASLTRRLQDIVKEIDTLEERQRLEGKTPSGSTDSKSIGDYDPDDV